MSSADGGGVSGKDPQPATPLLPRRPRQRRTSSPFAVCGFFSPDNTRYEEAVPFCGSSAPSTTSRPAFTATRARGKLLPDWIFCLGKISIKDDIFFKKMYMVNSAVNLAINKC